MNLADFLQADALWAQVYELLKSHFGDNQDDTVYVCMCVRVYICVCMCVYFISTIKLFVVSNH